MNKSDKTNALVLGVVGLEDTQKIVARGYSLRELTTMQVSELMAEYDITEESALRLSSALHLADMVMLDPPKFIGTVISGSASVFRHFAPKIGKLPQEEFWCVLLNGKYRITKTLLCSKGTISSSPVHPREVFAAAIEKRASAIVLVHNHPSGDPSPSADDIAVTQRLVEVGHIVGIHILDHVVIGGGSFVSFADRGLMGG